MDAHDTASAPPRLQLVVEFLNTPAQEPAPEDLRMARAVRRAAALGEGQATLAAEYGISRQLVSAIVRRKRLMPASAGATLGTLAATQRWLASHAFSTAGEGLSVRSQRRIIELQRTLLAFALANNGEALADGASAALERLAAETPLTISLRAAAPTLAPVRGGVDAFVGTVLAAVYDAMRDGTWARLKACPADRCQHVFYDTSRNRTATWCSMSICGNRTKVRKYQERLRAARG